MNNLDKPLKINKNFIQLIKDNFETAELFALKDNDPIIPINYEIKNDSKIMFVVGSNASGKSVVGKIAEIVAGKEGLIVRSCSMRNRTSGSMGQRLIFGTESDSSTGQNSFQSAMMGLKSTVEQENSVLILDEPDIGLADEYSAALGQYIAKEVNNNYNKIGLIVLITHSRKLIESAIKELVYPYSTVYVGDLKFTFSDWLLKPFNPASIEELLELDSKSQHTWKRIIKMQEDRKK